MFVPSWSKVFASTNAVVSVLRRDRLNIALAEEEEVNIIGVEDEAPHTRAVDITADRQ